jgi:hypothetical protein
LTKYIAPRFAGAGVALEFGEGLVERLSFGGGRRATIQQVSLVEFGEPGEKLGTIADGQLWQFFQDLSFAHGLNLARQGFSRKQGVWFFTCSTDQAGNHV